MSKKGKDLALFEAAVEVGEARKTYHTASLDLVCKLNEVVSKKDVCCMEAVLGLAQLRKELAVRDAECLGRLGDAMTNCHLATCKVR